MDERWKNVVHPRLPELLEVLDPAEIGDRLFAKKLVSEDQFHWLHDSSISLRKRSRVLLVDILPRKGRKAFDDFVNVLEDTQGQKHIVNDVLNLRGEKKAVAEKIASEDNDEIKNLRDELLKKVRELAGKEREHAGEKVTNVGLRNKIGNWDGGSLKWKMMKEMPLVVCYPLGCVAELNGMIHVGYGKTMYWLKNEKWGKRDVGFDIWSVFECDGKGYVVDREWKKIYEWKNEKEDLKLIHEIPIEYHMFDRSIGYKGKIYFVGGKGNRVDYFDINKGEWEEIKDTQKERWGFSLAVMNDKLFVGGGLRNEVDCYLIKEDKWIDIKPTTHIECQLSSWDGKLVATGGRWRDGNLVELYDDLSGEWLRLPSMNEERSGHGACTTNDNKLVVVGGWPAKNSVEYLKM